MHRLDTTFCCSLISNRDCNTMGKKSKTSRRKRKRNKKTKQKYLPVVVLNNQIPVKNDDIERPRQKSIRNRRNRIKSNRPIIIERRVIEVPKYIEKRVEVPKYIDKRMRNPSKSDLWMSGNHGSESIFGRSSCNGGCGSNQSLGILELLIFLAALAFSVGFLNQQITNNLGNGRNLKHSLIENALDNGKQIITN